MTRAYHGESADEFYGITCPEDVRAHGNEVPAHWLKHEEGCACLDCLRAQGVIKEAANG